MQFLNIEISINSKTRILLASLAIFFYPCLKVYSQSAFHFALPLQGPNYIWHLDGYDKLKPYGIAIHGAIDGYSRRMLWLEAGPTNQDPSRVAKYFVDSVKQLGSL